MLRDATALLERRRTEVRQGRQFPERRPAKPPLSFVELVEDALRYSRRHKPRSFENDEQRMKVLQQLFRGRLAEEITPSEITQKLETEEDKRQWAPATVNNYRLLLSMAFRVALEAGKVKSNPALGVKLRKLNNTRERWLSADEEQRLRTVLAVSYPDPHLRIQSNVLHRAAPGRCLRTALGQTLPVRRAGLVEHQARFAYRHHSGRQESGL